jgi:cytochrome oxidase Cu insertion factor (SCO1/SenC/PrrC family)
MSALWVLMVLIMVSVIGAGLWRHGVGSGRADATTAGAAIPGADVAPLPDAPHFTLVDQNNRPVTLQMLAGRPWIADLIFTHCAGPCPTMTRKMATLQKSLASSEVRFVSFSVDPKQDTPSVLKQYAQMFGADESRWLFLTGDEGAVFATARGMLLAADPAKADEPIIHSTKFVLIDAAGKIRKYYSSSEESEMAALVHDAAALAGK